MARIVSITYQPVIALWEVTLDKPTTQNQEVAWTVGHSSGAILKTNFLNFISVTVNTGKSRTKQLPTVYFKEKDPTKIIITTGISKFQFRFTITNDFPISGIITVTSYGSNDDATPWTVSGTYSYNIDNYLDISPPPGQAPILGDGSKGIALDYTNHLDRLVTSMEKISQSQIKLVENLSKISQDISSITSIFDELKDLAKDDGLRTVSPYEWLYLSSLIRFYEEQDIDLVELKKKVDSIPKD